MSAITDDQGYWSLNLGAARTPTGDGYYTAEQDGAVIVDVQRPDTSGQTQMLPIPNPPVELSLVLAGKEQ